MELRMCESDMSHPGFPDHPWEVLPMQRRSLRAVLVKWVFPSPATPPLGMNGAIAFSLCGTERRFTHTV